MTCTESNWCTLTWQPPPINFKRQGTILNYFINCATVPDNKDARRDDQIVNVTRFSSYANLVRAWFQPYQIYNCCVAAMNEAGRGNSSCQTIITHEAGKLCIHTICIKF